jgi:hypothetical protein
MSNQSKLKVPSTGHHPGPTWLYATEIGRLKYVWNKQRNGVKKMKEQASMKPAEPAVWFPD